MEKIQTVYGAEAQKVNSIASMWFSSFSAALRTGLLLVHRLFLLDFGILLLLYYYLFDLLFKVEQLLRCVSIYKCEVVHRTLAKVQMMNTVLFLYLCGGQHLLPFLVLVSARLGWGVLVVQFLIFGFPFITFLKNLHVIAVSIFCIGAGAGLLLILILTFSRVTR